MVDRQNEVYTPTFEDVEQTAQEFGRNELQRADKVKSGDKVNWRKLHRGGYGYTTSFAGMVIGETAKRVRIAVYNLRTRQIEEKLVHPASLPPRANHTELDDAMEQARGDAAP